MINSDQVVIQNGHVILTEKIGHTYINQINNQTH